MQEVRRNSCLGAVVDVGEAAPRNYEEGFLVVGVGQHVSVAGAFCIDVRSALRSGSPDQLQRT
jgi:hypothetical protein